MEMPEATEVQLRRFNRAAPPFHRHIARSKLMGAACRVGDRIIVYEITATEPPGMVMVTENTRLVFG